MTFIEYIQNYTIKYREGLTDHYICKISGNKFYWEYSDLHYNSIIKQIKDLPLDDLMKDKIEYEPVLMCREKIAIESILFKYNDYLDESCEIKGISCDDFKDITYDIIKKLDFIKNTSNK